MDANSGERDDVVNVKNKLHKCSTWDIRTNAKGLGITSQTMSCFWAWLCCNVVTAQDWKLSWVKVPRLMTFCKIMGSYLKNNLKISHLFLTNKIKDDSIKQTHGTLHISDMHILNLTAWVTVMLPYLSLSVSC